VNSVVWGLITRPHHYPGYGCGILPQAKGLSFCPTAGMVSATEMSRIRSRNSAETRPRSIKVRESNIMKTLAYQTDSRIRLNDALPVRDRPRLTKRRKAEPESSRETDNRLGNHFASWVRWLSLDAENPGLVNFPFAITVSTIFLIGTSVLGWGITVSSAGLTLAGVVITLVSCALYGWSLYGD